MSNDRFAATMSGRPDTSELEKMQKVHEESQKLGEFLDWLITDEGCKVMTWETTVVAKACTSVDWRYANVEHDQKLAEYAEIRELATLHAELGGKADPVLPEPPTDEPEFSPDNHPPTCRCGGTGMVEVGDEDWVSYRGNNIEEILAAYFGVDLAKADKQKQALLDWVREQQGL